MSTQLREYFHPTNERYMLKYIAGYEVPRLDYNPDWKHVHSSREWRWARGGSRGCACYLPSSPTYST